MEKISKELIEKCGVYLIFNLVSGKRYVGSSINIYNRFYEHIHILKRNEAHNKHLKNSWNKYVEESFVFQVLEYCEPEVQFEREQYYIDLIKPEYNLTLNVVANTGHKVAEETKKKISAAKKGNQATLGLKHTEETKQKMSNSMKGRTAWNKGKKSMTEENKKKLADARRAKKELTNG